MSPETRLDRFLYAVLLQLQRAVNTDSFLNALTAVENAFGAALKYGIPIIAGLALALAYQGNSAVVVIFLIGLLAFMLGCYLFMRGADRASRSLDSRESE